ncbi:MAG: hypothetical protein HOE90_16945 [Bacteriovoracaceae bacterium]|jgi:hypothetical protein|nr:hypothetical protein [Bacteriovoracaceae bacterium]
MADSDDYISNMLCETVVNSSQEVSEHVETDLGEYFETKLTLVKNQESMENQQSFDISQTLKMLDSYQIPTYLAEFIDGIGCYRYILFGNRLDFPKNWLFFENASEYSTVLKHYSKEDDPFYLVDALKSIKDGLADILFIKSDEKIYICLFNLGERQILTNLLGKKKAALEKKAA